jgi:hypothetical protein
MSCMLAHVRLLLFVSDPCAIQQQSLLDCSVPDASIPDPLRQKQLPCDSRFVLRNSDVGVLLICLALFQKQPRLVHSFRFLLLWIFFLYLTILHYRHSVSCFHLPSRAQLMLADPIWIRGLHREPPTTGFEISSWCSSRMGEATFSFEVSLALSQNHEQRLLE